MESFATYQLNHHTICHGIYCCIQPVILFAETILLLYLSIVLYYYHLTRRATLCKPYGSYDSYLRSSSPVQLLVIMDRTLSGTRKKSSLAIPGFRRIQGNRSSSENERGFQLSHHYLDDFSGDESLFDGPGKSQDNFAVGSQLHSVDPNPYHIFPADSLKTTVYRATSDAFIGPTLQELQSRYRDATRPFFSRANPYVKVAKAIPQSDGQASDDSVISEEREISSPSLAPAQGYHTETTIKHEFPDLTIAFPRRNSDGLSLDESSTPLAKASRPKTSFPFPIHEDMPSPLLPFSSRFPSSPLRPSQRTPSTTKSSLSISSISQRHDRFLPERKGSISGECFKLGCSPDQLIDASRVIDRKGLALDPFSRRVRTNTSRLVSRLGGGVMSFSSLGGSSNVWTSSGHRRTFSAGAI